MDEDRPSFGEWLPRRRLALHLTQQDLGRLACCSVATIRKLESEERRPSPDVAALLATALRLPEHAVILRFARVRGELRRSGQLVGDMDLLIGATALHYGLTVVTRNLQHFQRLSGLLLHPPTPYMPCDRVG